MTAITRTMTRFFLALACLLCAQSASAQTNLDKAANLLDQQSRRGKGEFITYLTGAAAAYRWAESYCPAPDAMLDGRSYGRIALEEYRRAKPEYAKLTQYPLDVLSLALLRGLETRYPCKRVTEAEGQQVR